jgi:hypothetical protein
MIDFSFTGSFPASACFSTVPLIVRTVGESGALEVTVTVFVNGPTLLVLYLTFMLAFPFGGMGSLGHSGTVQPQED